MSGSSGNNFGPSLRIAGGVLVLAVVLGLGAVLSRIGWLPVAIGAAGLALLAVLWLGFSYLLSIKKKQRSSSMFKSISASASSSPMSISEPAKRARLDDLRKSFENGIEKFRAADKDVYAVPWYVIVGEPGSGKTEAVRHCNIGFPPGLQDPLQGVGGTVNMNWWFTNSGVLLDTAGRLMFEEVEPGSSSEWQEFLRLLVRARPNPPINGMFLFISAESLIKDTAEAIEKKAGKIANQLDQIQRTLGVRFPVYVVVSKCDLINGFREFFDGITDPTLVHQLMGWSNPQPLDVPFDPELVDQHLATVQQRLNRRRAGLLLDPVNTDDPKARRADQVDALYAFPESLVKIGPRLRRYLEMVFVAGQWSAKPLFLRGIYFTSAMREGAVLDQELAEALGVPMETLPESKVWERDRRYFLRDVFTAKAFAEQGLVTRASNVSKEQQARTTAVLGSLAAGLLLIGVLSWFGYRQMDKAIGAPSKFWIATQDAFLSPARTGGVSGVEEWPFIRDGKSTFAQPVLKWDGNKDDPHFTYRGNDRVVGNERLARFPLTLRDQAEANIAVPMVFRLGAPLEGNLLSTDRKHAARVIFNESWLEPLLAASKFRLDADANARGEDAARRPWSSEATGALAQLIRLEIAEQPGATDLAPSDRAPIELAPLLEYVLRGAGNAPFAGSDADKDAQEVQGVFEKWYYKDGWPPESLRDDAGLGGSALAETVRAGLAKFAAAWNPDTGIDIEGGAGSKFADVRRLIKALETYQAAEKDVLSLADEVGTDEQSMETFTTDWNEKFASLKAAADAVDKARNVLQGRTLAKALTEETAGWREEGVKQHERLLKALEPVVARPGEKSSPLVAQATSADAPANQLLTAYQQLVASKQAIGKASGALESLAKEADRFDKAFLAQSGGTGGEPAYAVRFKVLSALSADLAAAPPAAGSRPGQVGELLGEMAAARQDALAKIDALARTSRGGQVGDISRNLRTLVTRVRGTLAVDREAKIIAAFAPKARTHAAGIATDIAAIAHPPVHRSVPMAAAMPVFDPKFSPDDAKTVLSDYLAVRHELESGTSIAEALPPADRQKLKDAGAAADQYLELYQAYWTTTVPSQLGVQKQGSFADFLQDLSRRDARDITDPLLELSKQIQHAGEVIPAQVLNESERASLDKIRDVGARSVQVLEDPSFTRASQTAIDRWKQLTPSADAAKVFASPDRQELFIKPAQDAAALPLGEAFWHELTLTAGRKLCASSPVMSASSLAGELRQRAKFPFATPGMGEASLADITAIQDLLKKIAAMRTQSAAAAPQVELVGDRELDACLSKVRDGNKLSSADELLVQRVTDGLKLANSGENAALACSLLIPVDAQAGGSVNRQFPQAALTVGSGTVSEGDWRRLRNPPASQGPLGRVLAPGETIHLHFRAGEGASEGYAQEIQSIWGGLWLIAAYNGTPVNDSRTLWEINVGLDTKPQTTLRLRLQFDRPLPQSLPWQE